MLNFFENINLKATRLLEGYYSLFCGLFTLRIVLIAINIYMFPSLVALLALDLRGYYLKNKDAKMAKFSFFNLARESLKAVKFIALIGKI